MSEINSNTSSLEARTFSKGLVKDISDLYTPDGVWSHARNLNNVNEVNGDIGTVLSLIHI